MGSGQLAAVADTGPLIHLAEIDCLQLLSIFTESPDAQRPKLSDSAHERVQLQQ